MTDITQWDPSDDANSQASPAGFPEGQAPSGVNNSARAIMGAVRRSREDAGWFNWGDEATFVSAIQFSVPGDLTSRYQIGRMVRATGPVTGTIHGQITGSTFVTATSVTVHWQDGGELINEELSISLGDMPANKGWLPGLILISVEAFTADDLWVRLFGARATYLIGISSGAAGGGARPTGANQNSSGSGGGAGVEGHAFITTLPADAAVIIGAPGVAVTGENGGDAGPLSFGTLLVLAGGTGGRVIPATSSQDNAVPGTGGSIITGGLFPAARGQNGDVAAANHGGNAGATWGGRGGNSRLGNGGRGIVQGSEGGINGNGYGGGGGGARNGQNESGGRKGGEGAPGILIAYNYR